MPTPPSHSWIPDFVRQSLRTWARDGVSRLRVRRPLPPSPPVHKLSLGHLHDIRQRGFVRCATEWVDQYGPLVALKAGPPVFGRRLVLVADPALAATTLQQEQHREFLVPQGPPMVFGDKSVFCTGGQDPDHAHRQRLVANHVSGEKLRSHAAIMRQVWTQAIDSILGMTPGQQSARRYDINQAVLHTVQRVAIRCWLGVEPTEAETHAALQCYYDPGRLLSESLFSSRFYVGAHERVARLRAYRPLLQRALERALGQDPVDVPQLGYLLESLSCLGWDRDRLARDARYRERLLDDLDIYKHIFNVMLPATGSTGGAILFLLFELGRRAELQHALRQELSVADLVSRPRASPLMARCIKEGLRLHPEALGISRTTTEPRELGGYFIPPGTVLLVFLHALHRDREAYRTPERFDPERFKTRGCPGRWAAFSMGKMACTGRGFAELHIASVFEALLAKYHVEIPASQVLKHNDYRGSVTLQPEPFEIVTHRLPRHSDAAPSLPFPSRCRTPAPLAAPVSAKYRP